MIESRYEKNIAREKTRALIKIDTVLFRYVF